MENIFKARPFKIRNADEYDISNILNLFVSPTDGLTTPFDYENSIIKGRMGSGKTMYLRANHAYHLFQLVPCLIEGDCELILPVFIRLNDFQHISKPEEIYRSIIIKVIEELTSIYLHLGNTKELADIHLGLNQLPEELIQGHKLSSTMKQLAKLGSEEYIERISTEFGFKGGMKPKFFELSAEWKTNNLTELKAKPNPGIKDIEECYKNLLEDQDGKILLLIDEAGSLDKSFFKNEGSTSCFFEILMNQFRTASFIRTKIAVYPKSYSDMLTEIRYGDVVALEDIVNDEQGCRRFRTRALNLIENYLNPLSHIESKIKVEDIFEVSKEGIYGDTIEQIMYASNGNMRRLIQLLDLVMTTAYSKNNCAVKINKDHANDAMKSHANSIESLFNEQEIEFLNQIVKVCKARGTYKFKFPNVQLYNYTSRSQEYNLINVEQLGSGRRGTDYSFDYSYCVLKDIPTHRLSDSDKIQRSRSNKKGNWITKVTPINKELIDQAALLGKIEGQIEYYKNNSGFILSNEGLQFFFMKTHIIEADQDKSLMVGKTVRFYPTNFNDTKMAELVEVL
jgi:hypothetical protein